MPKHHEVFTQNVKTRRTGAVTWRADLSISAVHHHNEGNCGIMPFADQDFIPVVLGTGLNAYGIARSLHEAFGVRTLALGRFPLPETSHSAIIEVRTSPKLDDEHLVAALTEVAAQYPGKKLLLLPTIEAYTNAVIRHRVELERSFIIPVVDSQLAQELVNKAEFYQTCARLGIDHPRSVIIDESGAQDAHLGENLPFTYPVILKPSDTELYPSLKFEGQKKIYLVSSPAEVRQTAQLIYAGGYTGDLIRQEYLAGDETVMRVANTYSDHRGNTRFVSIAQIVLGEHNPKLVGNMNAVVTIDEPELAATLTRLLDSLGYVGAANFDIMFDRATQSNKLLELNVRQGAASYYATASGHNLPAQYVRDLIYGEELPYTVTTTPVLWRNAPLSVIRRFVPTPLRGLVKTGRRNRTAHTLWYRKDLNPRRIIANLKHELRTGRNVIANEKFRINK
jgi:D-aspartate ligase